MNVNFQGRSRLRYSAAYPTGAERHSLVLFFEGTGQGVEGRFTNVTRLKELCIDDDNQRLHLESGPGTHFGAYLFGKVFGSDCRAILKTSRRWFQQAHSDLPDAKIFLFGFSRGALLARYFAEWLDRQGIAVECLGLWDTVDSTMRLDVSPNCPNAVRFARHAIARDERRRYFDIVRLLPRLDGKGECEELVFPGCHSDIGGLYEDNHLVADLTLAWIARWAQARGLRLKSSAQLADEEIDAKRVVLHNSSRLVSNLWGALGSVKRDLKAVLEHALCSRCEW